MEKVLTSVTTNTGGYSTSQHDTVLTVGFSPVSTDGKEIDWIDKEKHICKQNQAVAHVIIYENEDYGKIRPLNLDPQSIKELYLKILEIESKQIEGVWDDKYADLPF